MENEISCKGCIWEDNPETEECNNCVRLVDAPFNDYNPYFNEGSVVDNYEK